MSIRSGIYDLLKAVEADVYPIVAPQETADPYIVYSIRREPIRTQSGIQVEDVTLTLEIYANDWDSCLTLAASLYSNLENKSGTYGTESLLVCNWTAETDGGYIGDLDKFNITQEYNLKFE